jgi:fimbrial chaperone protein
MRKPSWAKMALAALSLCASGTAHAGNVEVAPVTVDLAPGRMSATLSVTNHGQAPTAVQLRGFDWTQSATSDNLARTEDLVVSPPIFQLGPNESQTVRVMLRRPAQSSETSYRILLDELPNSKEPGAIEFALRLSLPVFVAPAGRVMPDLAWHITYGAGGVELCVLNRGTRRDRVFDLAVQLPNGATVKPVALQNPYVLPGVERHMRLPVDRLALRGSAMRVTGHDDLGSIDATAAVQAAP